MNLVNLTYGGSRSYFKGIIEQGSNLATVEAGWSSYCRLLVSTRLNMKLMIGGVEQDVVDGRTLLDLTFNAAKAGKFTLDEAEAIASQLDKISLRYTSVRTPFFAIAYDVTEVAVEKDLTSDKEASNMDSVAEDVVIEATAPKQRGRKAAK
jgi:hypothetical protein